ncbi:unnamed protein product [Caenorhabditis sp. 36 PRJEB53466]|nr:unnamed protein product [Caenorhabditis sp. 36 PRJEB53466]
MEEWKASFRDIYGRSPTAEDTSIAPNHVKDILRAEKNHTKEQTKEKSSKRGVKRKNFEMKMMKGEQFSPIKKRMSIKQFGMGSDENSSAPRTSPRKKTLPLAGSPRKLFKGTTTSAQLSPMKNQAGSSSQFDLLDFSPIKSFIAGASSSVLKSSLTPIKSPTKRAYQRQLADQDLNVLLMPTPEKCEEEEEEAVEEFNDETTEDVAKTRAYKTAARKLGGSSKANQNFQKINLRKKQFVRGKVTAEQKRKLKRKQMFKKKT